MPAGGRRYRALELLIKQKRMAESEPIPCIVKRGASTSVEDDSLAENVHRLQLHPLDQFRAFQTLHLQGLGEEEIAARYFVSMSTVRQRLRLASVSPRLLDLYANHEMKLEQVMAFSITNDHVRQEQVWDTVSRSHVREPYCIRRLLTETAVRAADRRAVYVGIEAYEAAGGVVMRDLFEQDQGGWPGGLLGNAVRFRFPIHRPVPVMAAGEGLESILSLSHVMPGMAMVSALTANHLAAFRLPAGCRRLYIADADAAGRRGIDGLSRRAQALGILPLVLTPELGDFNEGECQIVWGVGSRRPES